MKFRMAQCTQPYQKSDERVYNGKSHEENPPLAPLRETVPRVAVQCLLTVAG